MEDYQRQIALVGSPRACILQKTAQNEPKLRESWAPMGKNCAVARTRESCAKVELRNIAIFWGGTKQQTTIRKQWKWAY